MLPTVDWALLYQGTIKTIPLIDMLTGQSHLGNSSTEDLLSVETRLYQLTVKDSQPSGECELSYLLTFHTGALLPASSLP